MKRPINQPVIVLAQEEREELKRLARKTKVMACFARRAKVILALDEGKSISETARLIDMERRHIYKWISRYKARGQMGLNDLHRPGRPKSKHMASVEVRNNSGPSDSYDGAPAHGFALQIQPGASVKPATELDAD